ncbi:MAG: flagellar filament capping protein FliD [Gallionellaceae bacterium]|nr:flagellar filament capping protein FliD [Gallionellaceae bacterium]
MSISPALIASAITQFKGQALPLLFSPDNHSSDNFAGQLAAALLLQATGSQENFFSGSDPIFTAPVPKAAAALHAGRNMALPDPESAYRMMSLINDREVLYKAQLWELKQMGEEVARLQQTGQYLGGVEAGSIKPALQDFISQYNNWILGFEADLHSDGLLGGTQAAQVSRYELEQSVRNIFIGASQGLHGMADLGVTAGPDRTLRLDEAKLDAILLANARGVEFVAREFGAHFAKSAELLNKSDNFIPRQLDNLSRAIHYIADNHTAWQAEFGVGDAAKPSGQIAKALAAYQQAGNI